MSSHKLAILILSLFLFFSCESNSYEFSKVRFNGEWLEYETPNKLSNKERTKLSAMLACIKKPFKVTEDGKLYLPKKVYSDIEFMFDFTQKLEHEEYFKNCDCKVAN